LVAGHHALRQLDQLRQLEKRMVGQRMLNLIGQHVQVALKDRLVALHHVFLNTRHRRLRRLLLE
jgi:hypothetical protein